MVWQDYNMNKCHVANQSGVWKWYEQAKCCKPHENGPFNTMLHYAEYEYLLALASADCGHIIINKLNKLFYKLFPTLSAVHQYQIRTLHQMQLCFIDL